MEQDYNLTTQKNNQEITLRTLLSQYLPTQRPKTVLDVLRSPSRSLNYIKNNEVNGELIIKAIVTLKITETLDFFSVTNSMSDNQIAITVDLILDEFGSYKSDFFELCFDNAKKFHYGKNYNRIDGQIIFEWLYACDEEYTAMAQHESSKQHKGHVDGKVRFGDYSTIPENPKDIPVPMPDYVKETLYKIGTKLPEPKRELVQTEEQKRINEYVNEFNELFEFHDDHKGGKRFIPFCSGYVDVAEFIQLRADREVISFKAHEAWNKSTPFIYLPKLRKLLREDLENEGYEFTDEEHPKNENLFKVNIDFN